VRSFGKIDHTIFSARRLRYLGMHFFRTSNMIKGKKEKSPVFFFQWTDQCNQPADQDKRKNKYSFNLSFQDQALI